MKSIGPKSPETLVAVKSFRKREKDTAAQYFDRVFWEFTLGESLVHENINQTISLHYRSKCLYMVMKYCPQGSLRTILRSEPLPQSTQDSWSKQLLRGVDFLHDRGIAHRDIKPENILLGEDGFIKIIDFGLAQVFEGRHPGLAPDEKVPAKLRHIYVGTRPYQPPEVFIQGRYFDYTKQDVWSCGVTLLAFTRGGKAPWGVADPRVDKTYRKVNKAWETFLSANKSRVRKVEIFERPYCGPIFEKLPTRPQETCLLKMLHPRLLDRISIKEALEEHWMKGIPEHRPENFKKVKERPRL